MKVAMAAAEAAPWVKVGGLADVVGSLPAALAAEGVSVHLFVPRYGFVGRGAGLEAPSGVTLHWVEHRGHFGRSGVYGKNGADYPDNAERFAFFCREVLARIERFGWRRGVLHLHDWHTALCPVLLGARRRAGGRRGAFWKGWKSVLTVHNLGYQGRFSPADALPVELDAQARRALLGRGEINWLRAGLLTADRLTTVSRTYAREIQTPAHGHGLEAILRRRRAKLTGILNGIDTDYWNPASDPHLEAAYSRSNPGPKAENKAGLERTLGWEPAPRTLLIGMVTRFAQQKGLDLVLEALPVLSERNLRLVILGQGDPGLERALRARTGPLPNVRLRIGFDERFAHQIYAGADAFLMPSHYEPCGLGQMIAMRYGTVPIVRRTGGLADTVREARPGREGTGFCFKAPDASSLTAAVDRALGFFARPRRWAALVQRGMAKDLTWKRSARRYLRLYKQMTGTG